MKLKRIVAAALMIAFLSIISIFVVALVSKPGKQTNQSPTSRTSTVSTSESPSPPQSITSPSAVSVPANSSTSSVTPQTSTPAIASVACGKVNGPCATAQIVSHNSATDCWIIYNGYYYIITSFASQHPGGASVFNSTTCGHDISAYLAGTKSVAGQKHHHSQEAYDTLPLYRIGPVEG